MGNLLLVGLAGFAAALVDGALGMGFGPTSSSLLLGAGLPPAAVSSTVNVAKVATGAVGAVSHWRFRNIDHRLVLRLAIPGCLGAVVGVTVLSRVDGDVVEPILAALLVIVALRMLLRFSTLLPAAARDADDTEHDPDAMPPYDESGIAVAAAAGGVTNGMIGAWGPVVTPVLMHKGLPPRFAIGSVNTAEVAVAMVSVTSLFAAIGSGGLDAGIVLAMLIGGALAAPLAAYVIRFVPARPMGITVASLLLFTNLRELAGWVDLGAVRWALYATVLGLAAVAGMRPRLGAPAVAVAPATVPEATGGSAPDSV
jgi:hypothetical protein